MGAVIAFIQAAIAMVPKLIEVGADVVPLIAKARAAIDNIGASVSPSDEEFARLRAEVAALEADFKDAVAEHMKAVGQQPDS